MAEAERRGQPRSGATIRDRLGVDTIEVRQSLDTALQIRRRLADNRIVAMLMDRHSAATAWRSRCSDGGRGSCGRRC